MIHQLNSPIDAPSSDERSTVSSAGNPSALRRLWFILVFNALFFAWTIVHPARHTIVATVANIADFAGPLIAGTWCAYDWYRNRHQGLLSSGLRVTLALGLGSLFYGIGDTIWAYYECIAHRQCPFPSWCDVFYLAAYPVLFAGVLLMPSQKTSTAARVRVLFDSLMIMAALVTFSWYFFLGPTILAGGDSTLAKILSAAYPGADIVLLCCLLLLTGHNAGRVSRSVIVCLSVGLISIITSDTIFGIQSLKNTYESGHWIDVGWAFGYMLMAYAGTQFFRQEAVNHNLEIATSDERNPILWRSLLPYAFVPAVAVLLWFTDRAADNKVLENGVQVGASVLLALILIRQVFALVENSHLYGYLTDAYKELQAARTTLELHNEALIEANIRLENLSLTDGLTGVRNHRAFQDELHQRCVVAGNRGTALSVVMLDVDSFKQYNDTFGHPAGDSVLKRVAELLSSALRANELIARYGGEEFALLLPNTSREDATSTAERLRAMLSASTWQHRPITASFGVATSVGGHVDPSLLVSEADQAMYISKSRGRNCVTHFEKINGLKTA